MLNDMEWNNMSKAEKTKYLDEIGKKTPAIKKILISVPTSKYIEPETFKSIYDLEIPPGYDVDFNFFYGYRIDQVRNLISDWVINHYDYLFSVDSDIAFPPHTLRELLSHDVDYVTGVYRQRLEEQNIELYDEHGRMSIEKVFDLNRERLFEINSSGFGCVLIKKEVFEKIGYPQFEYHVALDHKDTISEDTDFCKKARKNGFKLYADKSIECNHKGERWFNLEFPESKPKVEKSSLTKRYEELRNMDLLPISMKDLLLRNYNLYSKSKVIYDIGSSTLHWADYVKNNIWKGGEIVLFDAMFEFEEFYKQQKDYKFWSLNLLSDKVQEINYYKNVENPAGNSYYRENPKYSNLYPESSAIKMWTSTLDKMIEYMNIPLPDFIKIDVQGSELDILKGADKALENAKWLLVEVQKEEYNLGAPKGMKVIEYLSTKDFHPDDQTDDIDSATIDILFRKL